MIAIAPRHVAPAQRDYLWISTPPTSAQIIADVARKHGVTVKDLKGPYREKELIKPRFEAYARLRRETSMSLPQIARAMNRACHNVVLRGIRKHEQREGAK